MIAYLGLTSWNSFCSSFTRFGVVEPYEANLSLSVLTYKTGFVLISQGSIISHDWRHAENIISHFSFNRKLILRYLSISGSRKHLISIWGGSAPRKCHITVFSKVWSMLNEARWTSVWGTMVFGVWCQFLCAEREKPDHPKRHKVFPTVRNR